MARYVRSPRRLWVQSWLDSLPGSMTLESSLRKIVECFLARSHPEDSSCVPFLPPRAGGRELKNLLLLLSGIRLLRGLELDQSVRLCSHKLSSNSGTFHIRSPRLFVHECTCVLLTSYCFSRGRRRNLESSFTYFSQPYYTGFW